MTRAELIDEAVRLGLAPGWSTKTAERRLERLEEALTLVESEDHLTSWGRTMRKCQKTDCPCRRGELHGPYLALRYAEGDELYERGRRTSNWKRLYVGPLRPVEAGTTNLAEEWEERLG